MSLVLFLIDGLRPDGLLSARTPVLDGLMQAGSCTLEARTVFPSMTLPCHTSLFLGVAPERHGITSNHWSPLAKPVPGITEVLDAAGKSCAFFHSWEELRDLSRPGSLRTAFFGGNSEILHRKADDSVCSAARHWLEEEGADFNFVYFGCTDQAGHDFGWMSPRYLEEIAYADYNVGRVLEVLPADAHIIVTSDHGGHDRTHGSELPEDMTIPFIITGPGVPAGGRLQGPVSILDFAPTIAAILEAAPALEWEGSPIDLLKVDNH